MAAIMSPGSSPATSPPAIASPGSNPNHPALHPLITSPPPRRTATLQRPMSHASKNRLSQYSTGSIPSRSRPPSYLFPPFVSSLSYTLVRDFAYPAVHPMHYGSPPEPSQPPSGVTTPASESQRRLSDPQASWESRMSWYNNSWAGEAYDKVGELPAMQFADGPPWSEDDDLQSPVVSSRHRKHKSSSAAYGRGRGLRDVQNSSQGGSDLLSPNNYERERGYYVGTSGDASEKYYVKRGEEANGPGGEYVTYPTDQTRRHSGLAYQLADQQPRQYAANDGTYPSDSEDSSSVSSPGYHTEDQSRYSRDYQFTITSPDEEMHGKAVALFDFERENENELPLVEGQIIWVSYRHGQGWLVAEDPKTQENGLVPEEYVRLLRDIEGGMNSLTSQLADSPTSPNDVGTPTQAEHPFGPVPMTTTTAAAVASSSTGGGGGGSGSGNGSGNGNGNGSSSSSGSGNGNCNGSVSNGGYHQPVVSTFSTSSKDLDPYPQHLLGMQAGQAPPQVVHYHGQRGGSQVNTPTMLVHQDVGTLQRGQDTMTAVRRDSDASRGLITLPPAKLESPPGAGEEEENGEALQSQDEDREQDRNGNR